MKIYIDGRIANDYVVNNIVFNYDTVSDTFSLSRPFFDNWEKNNRDNRETFLMFKPLMYYSVEIYDNSGKHKLLTGTLLNHSFAASANANELSLTGYSKTGILDDCPNVQESLKTVQEVNQSVLVVSNDEDTKTGESSCFNDMTLLELAKKMVAPFKIDIEVDKIVEAKMNEKYEQLTLSETDTISSYLGKLATLKNIVMRSTPEGKLRFTQIDINAKPVANFSETDSKVNDIKLNVNGQRMHSVIYMVGAAGIEEQAETDQAKTGEAMQIKNPLVNVDRPTIIKQNVETGSLVDPAKAALAEELKNITLDINCKGWEIVDNDLIKPGDIITVLSPKAYIYKKTKFIIKQIALNEEAKGKNSTLTCILPEAMTGDVPSLLF